MALTQPTLYLFIGYPGAGKTSLAKMIQEATGGVHLWADQERRKLFGEPTHSVAESDELYKHLNTRTEELLSQGKSVIFDTNFNFYDDREYLRRIAARHGAKTVLMWLVTPGDLAKQRAVGEAAKIRNGYFAAMTDDQFAAITTKLEAPREDEKVIKIDGTKLDRQAVLQQLGL